MSARIDSRWAYDGQPLIRLENSCLAADVLPGMGGKVLSLIDKEADRNVLWRNQRVRVRPGPLQADVDDYFAGGWDDAFPTCDPCLNEHGEQLPYMGELWNLGLDPQVEEAGPGRVAVVMEAQMPITPARWRRRISLSADRPVLLVESRVENVGPRPFRFCWGSHAALAVHQGMRLDVPAAIGEVTDGGVAGALGALGERYDYPLVPCRGGGEFDVSRVPPAELGAHGLHALQGLGAGWAAATDPATRRGVGLVFDPETFGCVWQWMAYGGFRGWYHAILEPWTAPQTSLAAAIEAGTALTLSPGEALHSSIAAVLYGGVSRVSALDWDGSVKG